MADTVEAILGAVHLDDNHGENAVRRVMQTLGLTDAIDEAVTFFLHHLMSQSSLLLYRARHPLVRSNGASVSLFAGVSKRFCGKLIMMVHVACCLEFLRSDTQQTGSGTTYYTTTIRSRSWLGHLKRLRTARMTSFT